MAEVHYATGSLDQQVFVSRYLVALPREKELRDWLLDEQDTLQRILETTAGSRGTAPPPPSPSRPLKKARRKIGGR